MSAAKPPVAAVATEVAPFAPPAANIPPVFARVLDRREKRRLGDVFGLANFGVNLTRLTPGGLSALRHAHTRQDEFVYILEGEAVLVTDAGETSLRPGMCAGFKAGTGNGHHLVNETAEEVVYLEVGDRTPGDEGAYPDDDLKVSFVDGRWQYAHKDGTPY